MRYPFVKIYVFSRVPEGEVVRKMTTTTTLGGASEQTISPTKPPRRRMRTSTTTRGITMGRWGSSTLQSTIMGGSTMIENKVLIVVCAVYIQSKRVRPSGYLGSRGIINNQRPTQQKPHPYIKRLKLFSATYLFEYSYFKYHLSFLVFTFSMVYK